MALPNPGRFCINGRPGAHDLKAFVRHDHDMMLIDEVQHAPQLLPEIKRLVDEDPRPCQYLLTGSARVQSLPSVAESLAGLVAHIRLRPFAQGEIHGIAAEFLFDFVNQRTFAEQPHITRHQVIQTALRGGYPENPTRVNDDQVGKIV